MRTPGKLMSLAAASAMLIGGAVATSGTAVAAQQPEIYSATYTASSTVQPPASLLGPNGEKPTEWGVVAIPVNAKSMSPTASKNVGGGTWNYGTTVEWNGKGCYSNYIHRTKKHSATVAIAGGTDKDIQNADIWAKAWLVGGGAYTCYTYWGTY